MSSQKSSKWGSSQWDVVKAVGALAAKPEKKRVPKDKARREPAAKPAAPPQVQKAQVEARPRVSVVQPHARHHMSRHFGGAERAVADRDTRIGRRIIFGVIIIAIVLFATSYTGWGQLPGRYPVNSEPARQTPAFKPQASNVAPESRGVVHANFDAAREDQRRLGETL